MTAIFQTKMEVTSDKNLAAGIEQKPSGPDEIAELIRESTCSLLGISTKLGIQQKLYRFLRRYGITSLEFHEPDNGCGLMLTKWKDMKGIRNLKKKKNKGKETAQLLKKDQRLTGSSSKPERTGREESVSYFL